MPWCFRRRRWRFSASVGRRGPAAAIGLALSAAAFYALADQMAKLSLGTSDAISLAIWSHILMGPPSVLMLLRRHYRQFRVAAADYALLLSSGVCVVASVWALYVAFERADGVTAPNVILGARGLFVLAVGWLVGRALVVPIERQPASVYLLRAAGTTLFLIAIALVCR